ncbi:hypothetical protein KJ708_07215 [bacterium]|nr:hypothetical protein [bacterium]
MIQSQFIQNTYRILIILIVLVLSYPMLSCGGPAVLTDDDPGTGPGTSENEESEDEINNVLSDVSGQIDSINFDIDSISTDSFATVWDINDNQEYDENDLSLQISTNYFDISDNKQLKIKFSLIDYNFFEPNTTYNYSSPDSVNGKITIVDTGGLSNVKNNIRFLVPPETQEYAIGFVRLTVESIDFESNNASWSGRMEIDLDDEGNNLTFSFSTTIDYQKISQNLVTEEI